MITFTDFLVLCFITIALAVGVNEALKEEEKGE